MSGSSTARQDQTQTIMLVQAAEAGDYALVYALIGAGMNVHSANEHGTTALMAAAAHGHLAIVSFLLESGADFTAKRLDGFDALALAVFYGHLDIVRELLARGAKPDDRLGTSIDTWATIRGFHDIAHVLTAGETISPPVPRQDGQSSVPKVVEVEKQPSSVATAYVPKPRYNLKSKPRKLTTWLVSIMSGSSRSAIDSSYVKSTYVAKPRYRNKGKFQKLARCLAYITSDSRRLTGLTLIGMFVCGLGIVALLNSFGSRNLSQANTPVILSAAPAPDNSSSNSQDDLQSNTQAQPLHTTPATSNASAERSTQPEKKSDDQSEARVDNTEHSNRLPGVEPLAKSSERGLRSKAAMTSKQEKQGSASGSPKSIPSTNVIVATKPERPRRATGSSDQSTPPATSGRSTKGKVIQWP